MTAPLRRAHLVLWIVLGTGMVIVFAVGLAARRETAPLNPDLQWSQLP